MFSMILLPPEFEIGICAVCYCPLS